MVNPKAAIAPYIISAVAAPIPDKKPVNLPLESVRRIQSTPIGPTGAAMDKPINKPRKNKNQFSVTISKPSEAENQKGTSSMMSLFTNELNDSFFFTFEPFFPFTVFPDN